MNTKLLASVVTMFLSVGHAHCAPAMEGKIEAELIKAAREISATLPSGGPQSMVVSVYAGPGRRLTFVSVQAVPARDWTPEMKAHSFRIARNDYCTNPGLKAFRDKGVTLAWQSSDREGNYVTTNMVSPADCR